MTLSMRLRISRCSRVHLIKNVLAGPEDIRAMYAGSLDAFYAVKDKYDQNGLIGSAFVERLFGR